MEKSMRKDYSYLLMAIFISGDTNQIALKGMDNIIGKMALFIEGNFFQECGMEEESGK